MENQDIKIEHRGKFDVAIFYLLLGISEKTAVERVRVKILRRVRHLCGDEDDGIRDTIRLLEAVDKVDKDRALAWLKEIEEYLESGDGDWQITDEDREMLRLVRLPLSVLPD